MNRVAPSTRSSAGAERGAWPSRSSAARSAARRAALVLVALLLLWAGNGRAPLWDRDEPRFVQAASEMRERGDWAVPTFGGEGRYHKPILAYWVILIGTWTFGDGPFGARAGAGLLVALAALATALFARDLAAAAGASRAERDRFEGWAGVAMVTAPLVFVIGKLAIADGGLLLCVVLAQWAGWRLVRGLGGGGAVLGFWTAMGFGILAKGPLAPMVYLATLAAARCLSPLPAGWARRHRVAAGAPLLLAITLPWAVTAQLRTDGAFLREAIGVHVVERSLRPFEGHGLEGVLGWLALLPAYLVLLPLVVFPWSAPAIAGLTRDLRARAATEGARFDTAFLAGWVLGPLAVLSLAATKLPHYVLPVVPAVAIAAARWLAVGRRAPSSPGGAADRPGVPRAVRAPVAAVEALLTLVLGGGALWLLAAGDDAPLDPRGRALLVAALGLGAGCTAAATGWALAVPSRRRWALGLAAATLLFELIVATLALPAVGRMVVWDRVAADVRESGAAEVWSIGEPEPGLVYALGGMPTVVGEGDARDALGAAPRPGASERSAEGLAGRVLIADLRTIESALAEALRGRAGARARGVSVAKGRRVEMVVVPLSGEPPSPGAAGERATMRPLRQVPSQPPSEPPSQPTSRPLPPREDER